jgi:hypothetical protein
MSGRVPVPDVVIGGAPRSGTTFLCELLAKHPSVYVAMPFIPEPKARIRASGRDAITPALPSILFFGAAAGRPYRENQLLSGKRLRAAALDPHLARNEVHFHFARASRARIFKLDPLAPKWARNLALREGGGT